MRILALISLLCCFVLPRESRADAAATSIVAWEQPAASVAGPCIGEPRIAAKILR